jgi:integrase
MRSTGTIYLRRGRWWLKYRWNGKEYRQAVSRLVGCVPTAVDEQMARKVLEAKLRELYSGAFVEPRNRKVTVGDLLAALVRNIKLRGKKTWAARAGLAGRLTTEVGRMRAADLDADAFERLAERWREQDELAPATINDRLRFLRQALALGVEKKILVHVPRVTFLTVQNARTQVVTPEMWPAIRAEMTGVWGDVAEFAWLSAWRKAEMLSLAWADLDLGARRLRIETTKNGDPRILPLDDELWALIERRHRARVLSPLVFHRYGHRLRDRTANRKFQAAARRAGFDGLRFHDLRRAAITNMVDAGVPDLVVMAISGHRSLGMLKRYFIKNTQRMAEALAATRAYVAARQAMADKTRTILPRAERTS